MELKLVSLTRPAIAWVAANDADASAPIVVKSKPAILPCCAIKNPPISRSNAAVASLLVTRSPKAPSNSWTSSSISCGRVNICLLACAFVDEFVQEEPRNHIKRLENPFGLGCRRRERRNLHLTIIQEEVHVFHRSNIR